VLKVGRVRILYAISYYEDPGDPTFSTYGHHGDSEFIILEVYAAWHPNAPESRITCDGPTAFVQLGLYRDINLGNFYDGKGADPTRRINDCVPEYAGTPGRAGNLECYWTNRAYFSGWIHSSQVVAQGDAAGPYVDVLSAYGF